MVFGFGGKKTKRFIPHTAFVEPDIDPAQPAPAPAATLSRAPSVAFHSQRKFGAGTQGDRPGGLSGFTAPSSAQAQIAPQGSAKREVNVIEMLHFVKELGVDPVKESEMLWIAEEAYHAQIPPGWTEHSDDKGSVYFHNETTGESSWQHPMDGLFKQLVEYWRRVQRTGGFWEIEDELQEIEETIRIDLNDWMELFDETGEKFYYHRVTDESRFDDPRDEVYHVLYTRIRMVGKMKEKIPLLARAPRPEDEASIELDLQRLRQEEEQRRIKCIVQIQNMVRCHTARRRVQAMRNKRVVGKGNQPLKHRVQLRLENVAPGRPKEVVLFQTDDHRRFKAAQKIQAVARGKQTKRELAPVAAHRAHLNKQAAGIQSRWRLKMKARNEQKARAKRMAWGAIVVQSFVRARKVRRYVFGLRAERARFAYFTRCVVRCQSVFRRALVKPIVKKRRAEYHAKCIMRLQGKIKVFAAQRVLARFQQEQQPFEFVFRPTRNKEIRQTVPWSYQFVMHPINHRGLAQGYPHRSTNLFSKTGAARYKDIAATKIQATMRRKLAQVRVNERRRLVHFIHELVVGGSYKNYAKRFNAAATIQKRARGILTRKQDHIGQRYQKWVEKITPQVVQAQSYIQRYIGQVWLTSFTLQGTKANAAILIQAHWRAWLARRQVERMREEMLWPMKGWFEYTGMGSEATRVEVQFLANPRFDEFKHFCEHGGFQDLHRRLHEMSTEVSKIQESADKRDISMRKESKEAKIAKIEAQAEAQLAKEESENKAQEDAKIDHRTKEEATRQTQDEAKGLKEDATKQAQDETAWKAKGEASLAGLDHDAGVGSAVASVGGAGRSDDQGMTRGPGEDQGMTRGRGRSEDQGASSPSGRSMDDTSTSQGKTVKQGSRDVRQSEDQGMTRAADQHQGMTRDAGQSEDRGALSPSGRSMDGKSTSQGKTSKQRSRGGSPGSPKSGEGGKWSPRRGHLSPGAEARERGLKARPQIGEHPARDAGRKEVTSPMANSFSNEPGSPKVAKVKSEPGSPKVAKVKSADKVAPVKAQEGGLTGFTMNEDKARTVKSQQLEEDLKYASPERSERGATLSVDSPSTKAWRSTSTVQDLSQPRKHYAGTYKDGQFVKSHAHCLEDLSEKEKAQLMADIAEDRKRKVEELVRRQKKHAARRRKEQLRLAKKLGSTSNDPLSDDERRQKVRELKKWLKKKEDKQKELKSAPVDLSLPRPPSPTDMDELIKLAAKAPYSTDKLEQDIADHRDRRSVIAEQKRAAMATRLASMKQPRHLPVHHFHHHVHYHDGSSGDEANEWSAGLTRGGSAGDLRSTAPTETMSWRPLVHSASASQMGVTMPGRPNTMVHDY